MNSIMVMTHHFRISPSGLKTTRCYLQGAFDQLNKYLSDSFNSDPIVYSDRVSFNQSFVHLQLVWRI